jgi:hypothetical protein
VSEERRFELEDEDERSSREPPPALPDDGPDVDEAPVSGSPTPTEEGVDSRTLAERLGKARPRFRERVPPPDDWPRDAFLFPFRAPGPANIAIGAALMLLLDLMGTTEPGRFPAWILKLVLLAFLLRGQLRVIARSADGHDDPSGWAGALSFDSEELRKYGGFIAFFAFGVLPGWALIALELVRPGIALLAIGSMYVSVVALGAALEDPSIKWPWRAAVWMVRHPVASIAGSMGWWVLGLTEFALGAIQDQGLPVTLIIAAPLRLIGMYTLTFSARCIGVMGRSWGG